MVAALSFSHTITTTYRIKLTKLERTKKIQIMTDIQILEQVLNGHHLEPKEIERAKQIVNKVNIYLKQQKQ